MPSSVKESSTVLFKRQYIAVLVITSELQSEMPHILQISGIDIVESP